MDAGATGSLGVDGSCGSSSNPLLHLLVTDGAGLLRDDTAVDEDDEVGDSADAKAGGECRMLFRIHLENNGLASHFGSRASDLRRHHATGTAPCRPKVYEDGDGRILNDLVEERRVGGERLSDGRKWSFALTAAAGIGEVAGRDAILLTALGASADDGHDVPSFRSILRHYHNRWAINSMQESVEGSGAPIYIYE
jgi:hypothetical protein